MKRERLIEGAQGAHVRMAGRAMLNLCANNYLGLADDPRLIAAAKSPWTTTASAWPRSASSAARRTSTGRWKSGWRPILVRTTRSCSPPVSMRTAPFRATPRPRGRRGFRRAEPRQHHRRHPALQARRYRYANSDMTDLEAQLKQARAEAPASS